jgi:hypothetical protein
MKYTTNAEEITRLMEACVAKDFEILSKDKLIAEMKAALEGCVEWMEFTIPTLPKLSSKCPHCQKPVGISGMNWGGPISKARDSIAKSGVNNPNTNTQS